MPFLFALLLLLAPQLAWAQSASLSLEVVSSQGNGGGGGKGCSDPDNAAATMASVGFSGTCDTAWSDDFTGTGLPDSSKWQYGWTGPVSHCASSTYDNTTNFVNQSGGSLYLLFESNGTTATVASPVYQSGARTDTGGYPFLDWYREVRFQMTTTTGNHYEAPVITDFGYVVPSQNGYTWDMAEIDTPDADHFYWFNWGMPVGSQLGNSDNGPMPFNGRGGSSGVSWDNGWHWVGVLKQGATITVWADGNQKTPFTMPAEYANMHGSSFLDNTGDFAACPFAAGNTTLQIDYVHVYH